MSLQPPSLLLGETEVAVPGIYHSLPDSEAWLLIRADLCLHPDTRLLVLTWIPPVARRIVVQDDKDKPPEEYRVVLPFSGTEEEFFWFVEHRFAGVFEMLNSNLMVEQEQGMYYLWVEAVKKVPGRRVSLYFTLRDLTEKHPLALSPSAARGHTNPYTARIKAVIGEIKG